MTVTLTGPQQASPAEERRGGEKPDWGRARPGEELPEQETPPADDLDDDDCGADDLDLVPLASWCGHPLCGGD